jgi:hypothetical protein
MKSEIRNSRAGSTPDVLPFLVLCLFTFSPVTVQAQENLALGKPAVASSIEDNGNTDTIYYAGYASDGNPYTRWASYRNDNEWIYINLETSYEIQRIVLNWEAAYGKSYNIDVSFDGSNWKTAFEERDGDGEIDVIDFTTPVAAQYVRMTGLDRGTKFGFSLWEFEIYKLTPTELYVDKNGVNLDNNCLDPENPCATITYAIGQANPGNSINIAAGIYTEWFIVDKSLSLQGAGKDSTIIQGSSQQGEGISRVVTIPKRLIVGISDMTIRHGNVIGGGSSGRGGGIGIENSELTLENVDLLRNEATYGGGIHNNAGTLALTNVTFIENKANSQGHGGGMYNFNSSPELTNVIFRENIANGNGGGMANSGGSSPTLANVSFIGNRANGVGGGIHNSGKSAPFLAGAKFDGNKARIGGGLYNNDSSPVLSEVEFKNNEADTLGGGMANVGVSNPSLTHVVFNQNSTPYLGGGMYNEYSSPILVRTEFNDNEAENGGGMYNYSSSPKLFNLKFKDNRAGQQGGGLYNTGSSPLLILTNVIFTGNSGRSSGGLFNFGIESLLTNVNFTGNVATEEGAGAIGNYITSSITMINCIVWDNIAKNGSSNESITTEIWTSVIAYSKMMKGIFRMYARDLNQIQTQYLSTLFSWIRKMAICGCKREARRSMPATRTPISLFSWQTT